MTQAVLSGQQMLKSAYSALGYSEGELYNATESPPRSMSSKNWLDKGEWLILAKKVGIEKVFFVENNPVIVFAQAPSPEEHFKRFRKIWNLARPPILFLASPDELAVYDLTRGPARNPDEWDSTDAERCLNRVRTTVEVAEKLKDYRRERVETGRLFEEKHFGLKQRADKALISDLRTVRRELMNAGLKGPKLKYAHALIGRSIFIRYLEDRGILTRKYFKKVARRRNAWRNVLDSPPDRSCLESETANHLLYLRALADKDFTYALFRQLAIDFNGDMFPEGPNERRTVTQKHLNLLRRFLCGEADGQFKLFFSAYKFDVIPIELISSIYEEFYAAENWKEDHGTYYTPPVLAEFLLSQVLTPATLSKTPRVLDPAMGSGVFLVEAFRRIVRYHRIHARKGRWPNHDQLRTILRDQLAGIDINEEAVRVAAFSLYLAFLHYQRPPDILAQIEKGRTLPNLKYEQRSKRDSEQHFDTLLAANAFDVESKIATSDAEALARFSSGCADVVVGNPPWGKPPKGDTEAREHLKVATDWCSKRKSSVGDKERSQAFIHRTLDFLKDGGQAGLLVSSGIFFKSHCKSKDFRRQWLKSAILETVVNFAHVRDIFFTGKTRKTGSLAPFAAVIFTKKTPDRDDSFAYWSAKKTAMIEGAQTVILNRTDLAYLRQHDVLRDESLWKIYWWGNHQDERLISALETLGTPFCQLTIAGQRLDPKKAFGQGFIKSGEGKKIVFQFQKYRELDIRCFVRYGPIQESNLVTPPNKVHRAGFARVFCGSRLLVKRGITEKGKNKGMIFARLERRPFCFRNSIHGVRLPDAATWEGKALLGVFWSSLARYYYWLTAGSWAWHNEIHLEDIQHMPICLPENARLRHRIVKIVDTLREKAQGKDGESAQLFDQGQKGLPPDKIKRYEQDLDEAVFDLYHLSPSERDLIRDMCDTGLDLFYQGVSSDALKPIEVGTEYRKTGVLSDVQQRAPKGLRPYLTAFLECWNRNLDEDAEFVWRIICPSPDVPMLAVVFSTHYRGKSVSSPSGNDMKAWRELLERLDEANLVPFGTNRICIEGMLLAMSETDITIIKRNERRLWTASRAREDAESATVRAINIPDAETGEAQ